MPDRIQLSRRKGWRLPPGAVSVAWPTRWGNPYKVGHAFDRATAVRCFAEMLEHRESWMPAYPSDDEIRAELAGRDLACWCPLPEHGQPDICHAAVLIARANKETPRR